jgi:hypothetical protein
MCDKITKRQPLNWHTLHFRIKIIYKRIKSYHFVFAILIRNRIFAYKIVST